MCSCDRCTNGALNAVEAMLVPFPLPRRTDTVVMYTSHVLAFLQSATFIDAGGHVFCAMDRVPSPLVSSFCPVHIGLQTFAPVHDLSVMYPFLLARRLSLQDLLRADLRYLSELCDDCGATTNQRARFLQLLPQSLQGSKPLLPPRRPMPTTAPVVVVDRFPTGRGKVFPIAGDAELVRELVCRRCDPDQYRDEADLVPKGPIQTRQPLPPRPTPPSHMTLEEMKHQRFHRRRVAEYRETMLRDYPSIFRQPFDPFSQHLARSLSYDKSTMSQRLAIRSTEMEFSLNRKQPPSIQRVLDAKGFSAFLADFDITDVAVRESAWQKFAAPGPRVGKRRLRTHIVGVDSLLQAILAAPVHEVMTAIFKSFTQSCPWLVIETELSVYRKPRQSNFMARALQQLQLKVVTFEDLCKHLEEHPYDDDDEHPDMGTGLHWSVLFGDFWLQAAILHYRKPEQRVVAKRKKREPKRPRLYH